MQEEEEEEEKETFPFPFPFFPFSPILCLLSLHPPPSSLSLCHHYKKVSLIGCRFSLSAYPELENLAQYQLAYCAIIIIIIIIIILYFVPASSSLLEELHCTAPTYLSPTYLRLTYPRLVLAAAAAAAATTSYHLLLLLVLPRRARDLLWTRGVILSVCCCFALYSVSAHCVRARGLLATTDDNDNDNDKRR